MNKFYDKLLLAIAFLVLLGGIGLYLSQTGGAEGDNATINLMPGGPEYTPVPVPETAAQDAEWPEPVAQPTYGWKYDVFTPPEIYIDAEGEFTIVPIDNTPVVVPTFGVYLAEIKRVPYRIQLEGYIEEDLSDPSKSLLLFVDEESGDTIRARLGEEYADYEFRVADFDIERRREGGTIEKIATATIYDTRDEKSVVLVDGERLFDSGVTVVIRSLEDPEVEVELREAGETFETPSGEYVLETINLEESSVRVKKLGDEENDPMIETLTPRTPPENNVPQQSQPQAEPTDEADAPFDFMF